MNEDETIRQFLGERPGADQLREWRETLEHRLARLQEDRKKSPAGAAASLESKLEQLKRQIEALREEEAVTRFVEDSVRVTLAMGAAAEGMDEYEE